MTGTKTNTCEVPEFMKVVRVMSKFEKIQLIVKEIVFYTDVPLYKIQGKSRKREYSHARFLTCHFLHKYSGMSLVDIAKFICYRDHTSVLHAIRTMQDRIDTEESTRQDVHAIDKILQFKL